MRILVVKLTGELIEAQSSAKAGTLIKNAINAGYSADAIEERIVSAEDFAEIINNLPEKTAIVQLEAQKAQALIDNLPSWQQVSDTIDAATTIAACKVILKKLARVVYWLAKNRND